MTAQGVKSVSVNKFITKPGEKFDSIDTAGVRSIYESGTAHHRFNKDSSHVRGMYRSLFNEKNSTKNFPEYHVPDASHPPQAIMNCGGERISSDGLAPKISLTRNAPINV